MIDAMVVDLIEQTHANIAATGVETLDEVHAAPALAAYSEDLRPQLRALKSFLYDKLYHHERVLHTIGRARHIVSGLFAAYMDDPGLMPPQHRNRAESDKARAVADYIAGMTDRYAVKEARRIGGGVEFIGN
jgi:dGTPase